MSDGYWIFVAIGLALVALALGAAFATQRDTQRRVTVLEGERRDLIRERISVQMATRKATAEIVALRERIEQLEARPEPSKHDTVALALASYGDAWIGEAAKVLEQLDVVRAQAENTMLKAEWVKHGGKPDAPWSQIVKWKNGKAEK